MIELYFIRLNIAEMSQAQCHTIIATVLQQTVAWHAMCSAEEPLCELEVLRRRKNNRPLLIISLITC